LKNGENASLISKMQVSQKAGNEMRRKTAPVRKSTSIHTYIHTLFGTGMGAKKRTRKKK
jgi:hypothetical protein